jgi:hypothetical protein
VHLMHGSTLEAPRAAGRGAFGGRSEHLTHDRRPGDQGR